MKTLKTERAHFNPEPDGKETILTGGVSVQPLRRFNDGGVLRSPHDQPITVTRLRAAELVANGLVVVIGNIPANRMNRPPDTKG